MHGGARSWHGSSAGLSSCWGLPVLPASATQSCWLLCGSLVYEEPFFNSSGVPVCDQGRQGCLLESVAPAREGTPTSSSSNKPLPVRVGALLQPSQGGCEVKRHHKKVNGICRVTWVGWRGEAPSHQHLLALGKLLLDTVLSAAAASETPH